MSLFVDPVTFNFVRIIRNYTVNLSEPLYLQFMRNHSNHPLVKTGNR